MIDALPVTGPSIHIKRTLLEICSISFFFLDQTGDSLKRLGLSGRKSCSALRAPCAPLAILASSAASLSSEEIGPDGGGRGAAGATRLASRRGQGDLERGSSDLEKRGYGMILIF